MHSMDRLDEFAAENETGRSTGTIISGRSAGDRIYQSFAFMKTMACGWNSMCMGLCTGMDRRAADGVRPCFRCEDRLVKRGVVPGEKQFIFAEETEMILIVAAMEEEAAIRACLSDTKKNDMPLFVCARTAEGT
ncbi:MAG: hypothetical protein ACLVJ6_06175 [Merdibacter sp.]